jgi:hypothetical protein
LLFADTPKEGDAVIQILLSFVPFVLKRISTEQDPERIKVRARETRAPDILQGEKSVMISPSRGQIPLFPLVRHFADPRDNKSADIKNLSRSNNYINNHKKYKKL